MRLFDFPRALNRSNPENAHGVPMESEYHQLEFAQAEDWPEVRRAFHLLYRNYLGRGLIDPNPAELRYTHHNLLPEAGTFVAKIDGRIIATLSVIPDSGSFGLPMDEPYGPELDALRSRGLKLAEGSGLAVDQSYQAISLYLVMGLIKTAINYMHKIGVTDNVIACHPRHARFYKRRLLFQEIGGLRTYHVVNDAPAVALHLDIAHLEETYRAASDLGGDGIYRFFFTDEICRCPSFPQRAHAFSHRVYRELCRHQPAVIRKIEARAPEVLRRLTGWAAPLWESQKEALPFADWESPTFVAV